MHFEVLKSAREIDDARKELERRGISCLSPEWMALPRRFGLVREAAVGDRVKSWDVLKTAQFVEQRLAKNAPILDIGAYSSEILCVLHRLGYSALSGIDLNPDLRRMPHARSIRYELGNFLHTTFADESFAAITAISVIEHGFDAEALLQETARLLRPGGYFIASFDYWPDKIATDSILMFGMSWRIFSADEVHAFADRAQAYGFVTGGEFDRSAGERPISCANRDYTFAWLALRKRAEHGPGAT
jgi:SAM-dependent methyltransferase